ncbi:lipopolysaccharide kinase InaA family protein [Ectopseudomonas hydrolytica]|uniref:lipopolysaccharide kinase InaA family protein n=1 Tax=Ectopseudomonas hydrolytica TaxID=2493633 RepID=UPI0018A79330|nr:lipopolysaccharide kinase InaA family protein [Pseudomonas hydrolytica]MBF8159955.1 serine/threonine protein kinase [Pseudomonas mendocina]UTH32278.1 serine/threonine protein kinase [Pseudomonas hydrolytica]UZZ11468.1 serine/threonine protein kinase [Pseudomonas mendocina]
MPLHKLNQAGRTPTLPLTLELAGDSLVLERLLRVLPGQRYVGLARWQGRQVLAKVLVGGKAQRHFQRELEGAERMARQGLVTPELLAYGFVEGQGGWLLFEYLDGAQSLWQAWREVAQEPLLGNGQQGVLAEALGAIGQMHAQGLWQDDLHLDNLLRHEGRLYLIDGGGVRWEMPGQPLSRARVLENLGVFFAQLPAELDPFLEELLIHYLLANGEHALPLEMLQAEIAKVRRWRLRDYLKKAARDCSLFAARIGAFGLRVVRREAEAALQPLLSDLDARIEAGHIYKTGGAATVARVELDGRQLVVKRYNVKNWLHWLKRFWRPSRAWHSWIEGNRLELLGIATPRPLAVIERRWCWLRGRAYLITDYCGGQDIITRFEAYKQAVPPENELLALDRLFAALLRERISHGDFKGHNLFWDDVQGAWSLIDLDAMRQHHSTRSFARAYARDRARFLRNWPADSALHQLLDQRLPQVPSTCPN